MTCPTPEKTGYNKATATREATRIRVDARGPALEPYLCTCGYWHLTRGANLTAKIRGSLRKD